MTLVGTVLPMADAGPILKPMAVPDGRLGMGVGQVTTRPVAVCVQTKVWELPSNETEVMGATKRFELVASDGMVSCVPAAGNTS